jgi:hypothetical protein
MGYKAATAPYRRLDLANEKGRWWTWPMKRVVGGVQQHIKSMCNYILGPKDDSVQTHRERKTTLISTDHRVVYVDLWVSAAAHREYVRGRKRFLSLEGPKSAIDIKYAELIELQEKQKMQWWSARPSWISDATWVLIRLRQLTSCGNVGENNDLEQLPVHAEMVQEEVRSELADVAPTPHNSFDQIYNPLCCATTQQANVFSRNINRATI